MGLRGPAPKPVATRFAEGNPGKRAINADSPQFLEGEPEMPMGMSADAKKEWKKLVPVLLSVPGLLTEADGYALSDLCEVRARKLALLRVIEDRRRRMLDQLVRDAVSRGLPMTKKEMEINAVGLSMTVSTGSGYIQQHPDVGMLNTLMEQENRLRQHFGMSPASRSSLRIPGAKAQEADSLDSLYSSGPRLVRNG